MKFSKCNMIEGNLELDMRIGMESTSAEKFTEAFGDIEEITGYLLIRFSSAFMSLHMFKKLRIIYGQILWKNMYALVVFENQNLNQLFNMENKQMQIMRGKVSFQNNRMLCYKKIEAFLEQVGLKKNVTENDVSPFSNGDKAICEEIPLEVKIVEVYNYGFVVRWVPFNTSDMDHRKFLGYQIFYKKVEREDPNMSIDDERSACSDSWNMQFVTDERDAGKEENGSGLYVQEYGNNAQLKGELITQGVDANTLYAVYVQTRLVNHPGARNAISKIHFVRTTFGVPDPPSKHITGAMDSSNSTAKFGACDIPSSMITGGLSVIAFVLGFCLVLHLIMRSTYRQMSALRYKELAAFEEAAALRREELELRRLELQSKRKSKNELAIL